MFECATGIVARLNLHPSCHRKVLEILLELQKDFRVQLHDAVLMTVSEVSRYALLKQEKEKELSKKRIRRRTAGHRSHGIRGLPLAPLSDPEWDPDEPTDEELDLAAWAAQIHTPTPPAGGWDEEAVRELSALIASQSADAAADKKGQPIMGCCGSIDDLVAAGADVEAEERHLALIS
jgi:hypothetical protein